MGALFLGATSCSEPDDIITSVQYDRLFSPTEIGARVKNRTSVEISWKTLNTSAQQFTVELSTDEDFSTVQHTKNAVASPVLIAGLDGETEYFARVKSAGEGVAESKWSPVVKFKTDSENIFMPAQDGDLQATSVVLRWTPGEVVESIDVLDQENVLVKNQGVTAEECAAGAATITDLQGETTYTMVLKRNGKSRGTITVTTELDLGDAVKVTVEDDWYSLLQNAAEGTVFAFMPGIYDAYETEGGTAFTGISLSKSVSIKAAKSTDKPVFGGFNIKIGEGVSLDLQNVVLDGKNHADQAFIFGAEGQIDHLNITGSEICNFAKGFLYINVAVVVNTINIDNCLIHHITCSGGDLFDSRQGGYNVFNLTNSTIYNSAASRDVFRMDDASSKVTATPAIKVDHCTFYKVGDGGANYRFFYVRFKGNTTTFTNNVVSGFKNVRGFSDQGNTGPSTFDKNFYHDCLNLQSLAEGNTQAIKFFDNEGTTLTEIPFKDAENGDFTVVNEDVAYTGSGDPRWISL